MDLKIQRIKWVGNIYQKFEAVCQEVDDIVGPDAVKYLENQVQNVGDSVKKFYSGVVNELLPFPTSANSKYKSHSVALTNNIGFPVESVAGHKDNNEKRDEENPTNNVIKSLQESNAINIANSQQVGVPIKHKLLHETFSDSLEVEDSYITQEEVCDDSRETSRAKKEKLNTSIEEVADETVPKSMNLMSIREKEFLEFPIQSESYSDSSDSGCEDLMTTKDNIDVTVEQNMSLVVEENAINSSTTDVLSSQSLDGEESIKVSLFSESSDAVDEDTHDILAEVSPDASVSSLEFPIHSEPYSDSSDSGCEDSITTKDNMDVTVEQNSRLVVEENAMSSSTSEVLSSQSLDGEESIKVSLFSESSDAVDEDTHDILAEVSPDASVSSERPIITMTEPLCSRNFITSDSLYSKSLESYSFEIESCENNSGDATLCISDSSMMHICCESSPHVARQIMESQDGLAFSGYCQSLESNDKSLFSSVESSLEDIDLNDDPKLEENCVFVNDSELYAVSCRARKLRSYKKRIRDAFSSKKRLSKEYEQLAIWYGDTDIEPKQGFSQTSLPFISRTYMDSKNVQVQCASETEWELL